MLAAASPTYLQEYSVPVQIQTCLNCDPNIFEMCPKCCPKYFGYRSLRFSRQHSCNSVYMCVFLHVGSERFLPILKRVGKVLYYESLSFTFARKDVYKALFSKTWSRVSKVGCLKRSGSRMEIEWRGLDLRDRGGGKDWHQWGCPLLTQGIPAWLHGSEVPDCSCGRNTLFNLNSKQFWLWQSESRSRFHLKFPIISPEFLIELWDRKRVSPTHSMNKIRFPAR